jgi:hypothetical protein
VTTAAPRAGTVAAPAGGPVPVDADGASPDRVHLADAQRVLALFTQGLGGRYLHLRTAKFAPGSFRPESITTDGESVYLPPEIDGYGSARRNFAVYRMAVLHQLGYYAFGTFAFSLPRLRRRVPDLPAPRRPLPRIASDLDTFLASFASPALMRRLFVMIEDLRVDLANHARYPGARADLRWLLDRALQGRPALVGLPPLGALLEGLVQFTLGAPRAVLLAQHPSAWLARMLDAVQPLHAPQADVHDSAQAAIVCYRLSESAARRAADGADDAAAELFADVPLDADPLASEAGGDTQASIAVLDDAAQGVQPIDFRGEIAPDAVQRKLLGGPTGTPPEDTELEFRQSADDGDAAAGDESPARRAPWVAGPALPPLAEQPRSFLYDEWDYHGQRYLKGWCRLIEQRLRGDDVDFVRDVRRRHAALAREVRRSFRMIKPESMKRARRVSDGHEIDLDGMIESVIDRRTGHANDESVYMRLAKGQREVAAAFLVDMSASTDFPIPEPAPKPEASAPPEDEPLPYLYGGLRGASPDDLPPEPPKRRVIDVEKESLALMSDALHALGDSHAIYGFSGDGREQVELYVAKDFGDRLNARTWAALAAMKPRRSTRMGPAIRHALSKLRRQPAKIKVMIVVSDGYPQDTDYGPDRADEEYGIQDTARALQEAARAGVQTFCVTVDPAGNDYLRRMCAPNRYLVIDEVADLPGELAKVYRTLTASVTSIAVPAPPPALPAPAR